MAKKLIFVLLCATLVLSSCTISVSKEQNSQFDELTSLLTQAPTTAPLTTQVAATTQTTSQAFQPIKTNLVMWQRLLKISPFLIIQRSKQGRVSSKLGAL
jgi:hypothetical protein